MVSPSNMVSADSRHPPDSAVDEFLQILLRFQEMRTRQYQYPVFGAQATNNFNIFEVGHTRGYFAYLLAGRVQDYPELTSKSIV